MAMEVIDGEGVQGLFDHLEARKNALSACTDLYKSLTSHLSSLDRSVSEQSQTLDSKIQSLESESHESLSLLSLREHSIPERRESLSAEIEARKQAALSEIGTPAHQNAGFVENLRSLVRRMDAPGLLNFLVLKRRESLAVREIVGSVLLGDCVDPPRLVLDAVEAFVKKAAAKKPSTNRVGGGLTDWRWACSMVVGGLFPQDDPKESGRPPFAGRIVERAKNVVEEWKQKMVDNSSLLLNRVGPAEVAMLLQLVIVFGLKEEYDQEFLRKLVLEFAALRKDMPKLAAQIFEDDIGDIIDELVKNGMEIEAIYFATEAGLTQRFQPAPLLETYLNKCKRNTADIPKKGNGSSAASMDESINSEMNPIKAVIKCVEDLAIEDQFPLNDLRKSLADMEKTKADKKKNSSAPNKPSNKRAHGIRTSHQPSSRPAKASKISNSYPSFAHRNPSPRLQQSPVTRYQSYHGSYKYPTQTAYDASMTIANPYSSVYGEPLASSSSVLPVQPPHYSLPLDNVGGLGSHLEGRSSVYGAQASYNPYDYGLSSVPAYQP